MLQFVYLHRNSGNQILKGITTGIMLLQQKHQDFVLHCRWIAVGSKSVCIKLHQGKICELFGSLKNITPAIVTKNEKETNRIKTCPWMKLHCSCLCKATRMLSQNQFGKRSSDGKGWQLLSCQPGCSSPSPPRFSSVFYLSIPGSKHFNTRNLLSPTKHKLFFFP